jgi:hypothetical protein
MLVRFALRVAELETLDAKAIEGAISELLRAHRNGFHLVVITREAADYCSRHIDLSGQDKALMRRLYQEFTQTGHLHDGASVYVEIDRPGKPVSKDGRCIRVPLDLVDAPTFGRPSRLLTEDANYDAKLIRFILGCVRDVSKAPTFNFDDDHGGGTSTLKRYLAGLEERRIGVCILDTDRASPLARMCDTTTKAVSADAESEWPLFGVKPVPCHELENVIPHDVVTLLQCAVGNEWNRKIKRISDWENRGRKPLEEAFWLFFDVKEGLAATGLGAFSPAEMEWILPRLKASGQLPDGWGYSGYGQKVVELLLQSGQALAALRRIIRTSEWWHVFGSFFDDIAWFGAAARRLTT